MHRRSFLLGTFALAAAGLPAPVRAEPVRVARARERCGKAVQALFTAKGLPWPPPGVFVRVFKREMELEVWGRREAGDHVLVKTYPVCAASGTLGPKRRQGDGQVPEGFYRVDRYNPYSLFHLSLGLDYPNASDRILGVKGALGGDIFIHGSCVTIGCVPLGDEGIEEVYLSALAARSKPVHVHVFPGRYDERGLPPLREFAATDPDLWQFWSDLKAGYDAFQANRKVPAMRVDPQGRNRLPG